MNTLQLRNSFLLLLTAVIWGVAFVAQSVGMDYVGPYTFTCVRSFIGGLFLIPCIALLNRLNPVSPGGIRPSNAKSKGQLWIGGVCCGVMLCFASCFQQIGIMYTSVGKAGFITAFYIIIVPLLGLFFKKRCGLFVWLGVALAIVGLYFLCITESLTIQFGDFLIFICAILFSIHILIIDYFTLRVDGVKMSCIQFFVCGLLCAVPMLLFETPDITQLLAAWKPVLYAGIMSSGVAYTPNRGTERHESHGRLPDPQPRGCGVRTGRIRHAGPATDHAGNDGMRLYVLRDRVCAAPAEEHKKR